MFLIFTKKRSVIKKLKKLLSLSMTIKNFNRYSNPFNCRILFNYFWLIKVQDNKHVKWCLMRDQITFSNYKLLKCTSEERKCDWFFALLYRKNLLLELMFIVASWKLNNYFQTTNSKRKIALCILLNIATALHHNSNENIMYRQLYSLRLF